MFPFPLPDESMNRAFEGGEQREIEDEAGVVPDPPPEKVEPDKDSTEKEKPSDVTLEDEK